MSLHWTEIIILLFDRNAYKSEVKSCAEEESEDEISFAINIENDNRIHIEKRNKRIRELTSDIVM